MMMKMRTNNYPIKVILLLAVLLCFDFIYGQDTIRVGLAWKPSLTIDDRAVPDMSGRSAWRPVPGTESIAFINPFLVK